MQPEFVKPEFLEGSTAEEIHRRMMGSLPDDIDSMPGGFPYDFTKPAAMEKDEFINFHLMRAVMIAFPQHAWDRWLDMHGMQVHLERHPPGKASGKVRVSGAAGALVAAGTVFCTPATDAGPSIGFSVLEDAEIGADGTVLADVEAVEAGTGSNVPAHSVALMLRPDKSVTAVDNPEEITGGTEREGNDDFYDRIAAEYANSMTYLGNDSDYIRWAKEAGAGDCIVVPAAEGPGTVKLVLVDANGRPANEKLVQDVYSYIVSPEDRSRRLLPTACARLICCAAGMVGVRYACTGILHDGTTDLEQIRQDFARAVEKAYRKAADECILRYNDVRPLMRDIPGVVDFESFLMDGGTGNIVLEKGQRPETAGLDFSGAAE